MDRINSAGTILDANGHRIRQDKNIATGANGTELSAAYDNDLQESLIAGIIEAAGENPTAGDEAQVMRCIGKLMVGRLVGKQRFVSSGTYTRSAGVTRIFIPVAIAGGGSGGGSLATTSGDCSTASGGGTGAWIFGYWFDVTSTPSATVTIGAGGTISTGQGNTGGSTSIVGTGLSVLLPGGGGGSVKQDPTTTAFDVSAQGNGGAFPTISGALFAGTASGGVPGLVGFLFNGSVVSGQGASCPPFGAGGLNTNGGNGGDASGFGAGGAGAAAPASSIAVTGGLGAPGYVEIWEFIA